MRINNVEEAKKFLEKVMGGKFYGYYNPVGVKQSGGKMPSASLLGNECSKCYIDDEFEKTLYISTTLIGDEALECMVGCTLDAHDESVLSNLNVEFVENLLNKAYKTKATRDKAWALYNELNWDFCH